MIENLLLEFFLKCFILKLVEILTEFRLWSVHEGWEHDVPVVEKNFAVVLKQVLECQVSMKFDLLVWVQITINFHCT